MKTLENKCGINGTCSEASIEKTMKTTTNNQEDDYYNDEFYNWLCHNDIEISEIDFTSEY